MESEKEMELRLRREITIEERRYTLGLLEALRKQQAAKEKELGELPQLPAKQWIN